ncbi:hypothetical protein TorRG33x02_113910 [Trema orientale]|uniref:Uncharacterized protein n=1 Tax=Trema orientale TaxID=63057 RepID=A0A2P5F4R2_TREOI|nr:hypothetical protein TorRG33x02_113910 [Trema orientale]
MKEDHIELFAFLFVWLGTLNCWAQVLSALLIRQINALAKRLDKHEVVSSSLFLKEDDDGSSSSSSTVIYAALPQPRTGQE